MQITIEDKKLTLHKLNLQFEEEIFINRFSEYKSNTLEKIFHKKQYKTLKKDFKIEIVKKSNEYLGKFLLDLKINKNEKYCKFLNKYGDKIYSKFNFTDEKFKVHKGIYFFYYKDKLSYIGRCTNNFNKRINQGYGNISPTSCYKHGNTTNCHLNSVITSKQKKNISLFIHLMENKNKIEILEKILIRKYQPEWNQTK